MLLLFGVFVLFVSPGTITADPQLFARVKLGGALAAVAAAVGLGLFFVLAGHPERLGRAALSIERILPAKLARIVATFVETFAQGLAVMRQPARLAVSLVLSVPLWARSAGAYG